MRPLNIKRIKNYFFLENINTRCDFTKINIISKYYTNVAFYQSQVSILGPVGYGPTTLPLRPFDEQVIILVPK